VSLINEALKEARHEATRQDAIRDGGLYPRVPHHGPPAERRRRWWIAAVVTILVLTGIGIGWWWRTQESRVAPETPVEMAVPAAAAHDSSTEGEAGESTPTPSEAPPDAVAPTTMVPASPAIPPRSEAESEAPTIAEPTATVRARTEPVPTPAAAAAPPTLETASDAITFHKEARLKDGTHLSLGGIAWSSTQPVALINGQVIDIGEITEGFVLLEVRRDYVYLKRGDQVVILTLK